MVKKRINWPKWFRWTVLVIAIAIYLIDRTVLNLFERTRNLIRTIDNA